MEQKSHLEKRMEYKVKHYVGKGVRILVFILFGIAFFLLVTYGLMWLWNWLMPDIFGLPTIDYWQALGLFALAKIIFGFGFGDSDKGKGKKKSRKNRFKGNRCSTDLSDWKLYDEFWEKEGQAAFSDFVNKKNRQDADGQKEI